MSDFNYDKAEADLYDSDCPYSDEIYEYSTDKGRNEFLRENGLDPSKYYNNSGSSGSSNDNNSGCYLTTACVVARGLPDNCIELVTLRHYRDTYLKNRAHGEEDINTYYQIAPKIVSAINALPDARHIWEGVYTDLIEPCINLINQEKPEDAYHLYRGYTMALGKRYLK